MGSLVHAITVGISRQQAARARDQATAAQLLAIGRLRLADSPNAALAYAIASLERSDNGPARRFAVEALWQGPPALFLEDATSPSQMKWSADGRWLAITGNAGLALFERDTNARRQLSGSYENPIGFSSDSRRLVTGDMLVRPHPALHVWALPEGRLERTLSQMASLACFFLDDRVLIFAPNASAPDMPFVHRLSLDGTTAEVLGRLYDPDQLVAFDPSGTSVAVAEGGRILLRLLDALSAPPRIVGTYEGEVATVQMRPWSDRIVTGNLAGEVRIWHVRSARLERTLASPAAAGRIAVSPRGR